MEVKTEVKKIFFALIIAAVALTICACGRNEDGRQDGDGKNENVTEQFDGLDISLGAEKIFEEVKERSVVVFDGATLVSGGDVWDAFYADVQNGRTAFVPLARYYTLDPERVSEELYEAEKDNYPQIFLSVIVFDGEKYDLIEKGEGNFFEKTGSYKYLKKFEGDLPSTALYKHYTEYVLVDDDKLTHKDIERSMYSSDSSDFVRSRTVYSDYYD